MQNIKFCSQSKVVSREEKQWQRQIIDVSKSVAAWVFVTAASFGYWLVVLLIASLVLLNIWHVTFDSILKYSFVLMIITSVVYLGMQIRKWVR